MILGIPKIMLEQLAWVYARDVLNRIAVWMWSILAELRFCDVVRKTWQHASDLSAFISTELKGFSLHLSDNAFALSLCRRY